MTRRLSLALTLGAGLLCISGVTCGQNTVEPSFTLTQVGPNVWAAISNPKSTTAAGANTGFVIGDDSVAVIDATLSGDADGNFGTVPAREVLAAIRRLTTLPIRFVINTHYHFDHTGGNAVFVNAGAVAVAHQNVRAWTHSENIRLLGKDVTPTQQMVIEAIPLPTVAFDQALDLHLGSRLIRVRSFPGHTGGDSVVQIPDAKVVFAGDLFWRHMVPNMIDASMDAWINTLATLAKSEPDATFVSGHGDVGHVRDVDEFRDYLATLGTLVSEARARGQSGDALADAVMPAFAEKYGSWEAFTYLARPNILDTDAELSGTKRIPQPAK